jgi:hypothetical protein
MMQILQTNKNISVAICYLVFNDHCHVQELVIERAMCSSQYGVILLNYGHLHKSCWIETSLILFCSNLLVIYNEMAGEVWELLFMEMAWQDTAATLQAGHGFS